MALAQIGPLTTVMELLATAVGAGMLLGAFGAGAVGSVVGLPRTIIEGNALTSGYLGGIGAILVVLADLIFDYIL